MLSISTFYYYLFSGFFATLILMEESLIPREDPGRLYLGFFGNNCPIFY